MELVKSEPATSDLDNFIDFLFEGLEGYAYLVAREPNKNDPENWNQEFFQFPAQRNFLIDTIRRVTGEYEVYLAPVLYQTGDNARRENVKVSNVVWTEFDGNAPDWTLDKGGIGEPSYRIQSSLKGHEHVYWKLNDPIYTADAIESITERITYKFKADSSAWDATQVLRPPDTVNHKRGRVSVVTVDSNTLVYDISLFESLDPAPERLEINWKIGELPDLQSVLLSYALGPDIQGLLKKTREEVKDRSASLMQLGYACCQLGMEDNEVFVVVDALARKWGKFEGRRDRERRLADLVTKARHKYPKSEDTEKTHIFAFDYKTFMASEIEIDWVIEGMLMDRGSMLFTGPSGIGKTQFSLQFMKHVALGKDYLHYKIPKPKKVGFLSLEMGHPELQEFLRTQETTLTAPEIDQLAENLTILPVGESWALNTPVGQEMLLRFIESHEWDGVFLDSVGSAILGNINSQEVVQSYLNFIDRLRNRYGIFWWHIHHNRKKQPGQSHSTGDDIYGDQYLLNRATSSYSFLWGKNGIIRVANFKNRMAKMEKPYSLHRTDNLNFTLIEQAVEEDDGKPEKLATDEPIKSKGGLFEL